MKKLIFIFLLIEITACTENKITSSGCEKQYITSYWEGNIRKEAYLLHCKDTVYLIILPPKDTNCKFYTNNQ